MGSPAAIQVDDLVVRFGDVTAVDGVSFGLAAGGTLGLLGGNGAGKTTTISTVLGLVTPASGSVKVLGVDMSTKKYAVMRRINFSSPYVALPALLTVRQILRLYSDLYNVTGTRRRLAALVEDLDLHELVDRPYGELSAGQKTRVSLAKALVNRPEVLLLDEPTASLDPETADWVRSLLERYRTETGASILIASHNMAEVQRLCTDVVILGAGRIIEQDAPDVLLAKYHADDFETVFMDVAAQSHAGPAAE